ncbi:hypothetical protein, partial [Pseudomonas sp. JAI120]|uniref:hypothetical protein n=1 Tax=Pseudomonas sp. JAI120 TaxID=2723063 RepID=UPI0030EE52BA
CPWRVLLSRENAASMAPFRNGLGVRTQSGPDIRGVLMTAPMSCSEGKADMYRWVRDYRFLTRSGPLYQL